MADTRQIVQWALEHKCMLRITEESAINPSVAMKSVSEFHSYSKGLRDNREGFGVFGDIYVSSYTLARASERKAGACPSYPSEGFVVSQKFQAFGGPDALFSMCHQCPANIRPHNIADCVGHLFQGPDYPQTEEQLQGIISRFGLDRDVADHFPRTTPLWYGLWAVSPVPADALPILRILMSEIRREDQAELEASKKPDLQHLDQFTSIISAIDLAKSRNLNLHVRLLPLGHTDFGFYTIFPHCPFCKAAANVGRWQRKYPAELQTCRVCGSIFSPAETASVEKMDWKTEELRDTLGENSFRRFAVDYLIAQGEGRQEAERIMEETEAAEAVRREKNTQRRVLEKRKSLFLDQHVFAGLERVPPPPSEFADTDVADVDSPKWFDSQTFSTALHRCIQLGINVTVMQHYSSNEDLDRFQSSPIKAPMEIFDTWLSDGCNEKFYLHCIVPDALIEADDTPQ